MATVDRDDAYLVDWLHRINDRASLKATTWQRVAELAKAAETDGGSLSSD
jgi:hypothetical protein